MQVVYLVGQDWGVSYEFFRTPLRVFTNRQVAQDFAEQLELKGVKTYTQSINFDDREEL